MSAINAFLLQHNLRIAQNPCISPDFCLDWRCAATAKLLASYPSLSAMMNDISR
ncbi:MAG: hypothetical protein WCI28_05305 [Opitutaceae bacterium]